MRRFFSIAASILMALLLIRCGWPAGPTPLPTLPAFQVKAILDLNGEKNENPSFPATFAIDQTRGRLYVAESATVYTVQQVSVTHALTLPHLIDDLVVNPNTRYLYAGHGTSNSQVSVLQNGKLLVTRPSLGHRLDSWAIVPTSGNVYATVSYPGRLLIYDPLLEPIHEIDINVGSLWVEPERGWVYAFDHDLDRQRVISGTKVIGSVPGYRFVGVNPRTGYAHFADCTVVDGLRVMATPAAHCFLLVPHIVHTGNGLVYRLSPNSDQVTIWQDGLQKIAAHNPDPTEFLRPTEGPRPGAADPKNGYVYLQDTGSQSGKRLFVYKGSEYLGEQPLPSAARHILADPARGWVYVACENEIVVLYQGQIVSQLDIAGARLMTVATNSGLVYYQQDNELGVIIPPREGETQ